MQEVLATYDPFIPTFSGSNTKNTIIDMFNKQKSKTENLKNMTGINSVGTIKLIEEDQPGCMNQLIGDNPESLEPTKRVKIA